ncbi:hypothetical protein [Sodalis sp. RH20]|uniref:hypothetical protein n=1 Tax=unclassified Sodalis (in: enterobacteria) TaxID=2636512 RepID=UPI0039B679B9
MKTFKGLTWDHPRGHRPLQAWAREDGAVKVDWAVQKLEGFESHPIDELAERYDFLIVDNPGIGEAAEKGCLRPLEAFLSEAQLSFLRNSSVGPSFDSYQYYGRHWAIPIDAAAQVCALAGQAASAQPDTWQEVLRLSRLNPGRVALSLGGPHALLTFYAISLSLGGTLFLGNDFVLDKAVAAQALTFMREIYSSQQPGLVDLNPIGLLDEMAQGRVDLCPAIFGYVTYATPDDGRPVSFVDIPHCGEPAMRGSILGGTGLAISVHCGLTPGLIDHIMRYVSERVQSTLVVENGGQPANVRAWHDHHANELTGNFFRNTFSTVANAYVRPKYHGYIPFQDSSSAIVRDGLVSGKQAGDIFDAIRENHGRYLP